MALRSTLSRYKSISRPSLRVGSFSSFSNSLVKKTNSAEDAIVDNQYEEGLLSSESYLLELQKRGTRDYITPLQKVSISEKMDKVQEAVIDAQVDKGYAAGTYNTDQVTQYEKAKLAKMTEPNSVAYIKQSQKVQGLVDKSEKEKRTAYRVSTNLQISKMPEDTSDRLYAKTQEYQKLENQARLDGDIQQADVFATQKNNLQGSFENAVLNDQYTALRGKVAEIPPTGLGVPSSEEGKKLFGEMGGQVGIGFENPAIKNAYESLDANKKSRDRLIQQQQIKETQIMALEQIYDKATGDKKNSWRIQLDNEKNALEQIKSQLANANQNFQDIGVKIQEIQQKQVILDFHKTVTREGVSLNIQENDLENRLRKGKIIKEDYIRESINLVEAKKRHTDWAANGFRGFGEEGKAEKLEKIDMLKLSNTEASNLRDQLISEVGKGKDQNQVLSQIGQNYEMFRVEPGGTMDNISGTEKRGGEITLKNFQKEKAAGVFGGSYVNDSGVFTKIHYEGEQNPLTGDLLSAKDLANKVRSRGKGSLYFFDANGNKKSDSVGIIEIKRPDGITTYVPQTKDFINRNKNIEGIDTEQDDGTMGKSNVLYKIKERPKFENPFLPFGKWTPDLKRIPRVIQRKEPLFASGSPGETITRGIGNFLNKAISGTKDLFGGRKSNFFDMAKQNTSGFLGNLTPQVQAAEKPNISPRISSGVAGIIDRISNKYAPGDEEFRKVMHAIALAESGGRANARGDNGNSIGVFQNNMAGGRGQGHTLQNLLNPEYNTEIAAKELIRFYKQGVQRGLRRNNLVAYVSKYGQRPAAGNELQAARRYGQFVPGGEASVSEPIESVIQPAIQPDIQQKKRNVVSRLVRPVRAAELEKQIVSSQGVQPKKPSWQPPSPPIDLGTKQPPSSGTLRNIPTFKMPTFNYNPIRTFKENVGKTVNVVQQIPQFTQAVTQKVGNVASNVVEKAKSFVSNLFRRR